MKKTIFLLFSLLLIYFIILCSILSCKRELTQKKFSLESSELPAKSSIHIFNTPELSEQGGQEAKDFLSGWIYRKPVYLDIDDYYQFDSTGTRIVCVVYTYYNTTHLLNVNKLLLNEGHAVIDNHDNEFNPNSWSLYVINPTPISSPSPTPTITPTPTPTTTPTPTPTPIISPTPTQTPQPSTSPIDPLILGLLIVIAILGSVIFFLLFRKK